MFAVPLTERVALYTVMTKWRDLLPAPGCGEWALPAGEDACLLCFELSLGEHTRRPQLAELL
jgi:hypothetical protein